MTKPVKSSNLPWEQVTFNPGVELAGVITTVDAIAVGDKIVFILPAWGPNFTQEHKEQLLKAFHGRIVKVEAKLSYELTGRAYDPQNFKKKES